MTENELIINGKSFNQTISQIEEFMESDDAHGELFTVLRSARDFMENLNEEIQQYKEIGTVERFRFLQEVCDLTGDELEHIANSMIELKNYRAIGTIEELKALKEKSVVKNPIYAAPSDDNCFHGEYVCPNCYIRLPNFSQKYCQCGQRLG